MPAPVLTLSAARLAYGHHPLLDGAGLTVEARERVGLIGRNGTGKSSLLAVLAGEHELDDGECWRAPDARIALVPQTPMLPPHARVYEAVAGGLPATGALLDAYHVASERLAHAPDDEALHIELDRLQAELDAHDAWNVQHRVDTVLTRLGLDADARVGTLSGGWQKRVALARALVAQPDVLLLDEPTNHLDIAAIEWLEDLVAGFAGAIVCVTHDRRFLDSIVTRIVELDRGQLRSYPGSFAAYEARKTDELAAQAQADALFDRRLADEEVWIRKGVEARRTRNEGRVRRLEALRVERAARRERLSRADFAIDDSVRSGALVAELEHVHKGYDSRVLIRDFSTRVMRGDRIGLIGPNGCGKTTLLRLILGEIEPDAGCVRRGSRLEVAYFDQLRDRLDPEATLAETISPGAEFVETAAGRRHVMTYLGDFLFAPERARSPVSTLSGGERGRLLLARLLAQPANVLVLDEPTNDLDLETLELLEERLSTYTGTLFVVSHDRAFLDAVVTQTIAFEGNGVLVENAGGYSDWKAWKMRQAQAAAAPPSAPSPATSRLAPAAAPPAMRKLTPPESRELAGLPERIDALEAELDRLHARFNDPALYGAGADALGTLNGEIAQQEDAIARAYARWEALEARRGAA